MVFACVRFANVNVKGLRRVQRLTKYVVGCVGATEGKCERELFEVMSIVTDLVVDVLHTDKIFVNFVCLMYV